MNRRGLDQMDSPEKALENMLTWGIETRKLIGNDPENLMVKPAEGQGLAEYRKANADTFGAQSDPAAFEIDRANLPEGIAWNDALEAGMRDVAVERGLSGEDVQAMADLMMQHAGNQKAAAEQIYSEANEEMMTALKAKHGDDFKHQLTLAGQAMTALAESAGLPDETITLMTYALKEKGGDAATIEIFAEVGKRMMDDTGAGLGQGENALGLTPQEAKRQLDEFQREGGEWDKAYRNDDHATMKRLQPKRRQLMRAASGG